MLAAIQEPNRHVTHVPPNGLYMDSELPNQTLQAIGGDSGSKLDKILY